MVYGYARVSSLGQDKYGNSKQGQTEALLAAGCEKVYYDHFTGTKMDRPEFTRLMGELKEGDTLKVTKLDRFARTAIDGIKKIDELMEMGVNVHILNMGLVENTLTGNLILTVMLAFAEYERGMIVERTQAGREVARQDPNYREGRPKKYLPTQINHALELLKSGKTYRQVEAMTGISKSTLVRNKK